MINAHGAKMDNTKCDKTFDEVSNDYNHLMVNN